MFKNVIRDYLSKPVIWYLKYKKWEHINIIINIDGTHIDKRDIDKENKNKEMCIRAGKIFKERNKL